MTGDATTAESGLCSPLIPLIIGGALMIQTINATVVTNALPAIAEDFGRTPLAISVTITCYLLAQAVCLPISAWTAERFGTRTVFRAAIVVYLLANIACGLSQSVVQLVCARTIGGAAAALMMPVGRLVLLRTAPRGELVRAMSLLMTPAILGPALGPPIGGFITTSFSWRWVFMVNVPFGLIAIALVGRHVPQIVDPVLPRLDVTGFLLTGAGLAAVILALQSGDVSGVPGAMVPIVFIFGCACLLLYAVYARRVHQPMLDLSVLRSRTFVAGVIGGQCARIPAGALPFALALLLQVGLGFSAFHAGMLTFASTAAALLMKFAARPIIRALGFRNVLIWNSLLVAATLAPCALIDGDTSFLVIAALLFLGGFFRSLLFTALNALAFVDLPAGRMSSGSTVQSMAQSLAQSIGIAMTTGVVHAGAMWHGGAGTGTASIAPVFLVLAGVTLAGLIFFIPLPRDVGHDVSGHRRSMLLRADAPEG